MKLFFNRPSPYARKVLVVAHEKGLVERIEMRPVDPWADPEELVSIAPIGKVPALVTDDGATLSESAVIAEYLDAIGDGPRLNGPATVDVMGRAALGQGIIDAAFGTVIERRRPADKQWDDWIARQRRAIERSLRVAAVRPGRFDLGDIALACGLAYLDFRLPEITWREAHPALAAWLDEVGRRPSMAATKP
jgi:glutathione S-transferase